MGDVLQGRPRPDPLVLHLRWGGGQSGTGGKPWRREQVLLVVKDRAGEKEELHDGQAAGDGGARRGRDGRAAPAFVALGYGGREGTGGCEFRRSLKL